MINLQTQFKLHVYIWTWQNIKFLKKVINYPATHARHENAQRTLSLIDDNEPFEPEIKKHFCDCAFQNVHVLFVFLCKLFP